MSKELPRANPCSTYRSSLLLLILEERSASVNYLFSAIVATMAALVSRSDITLGLAPLYFLPFLAVLLASLAGGMRSGFVAAFIGALGLGFSTPQDYIRVLSYVITAAVCGVVVDELRYARRVAEREVGAREKVMGIVAHDLRNPLTNLSMKVHVLRRGPEKDQPIERHVRMIDSMWFSIERMTRIIEDLLDATRIDAGNFNLELSDCRIDYLLDEILDSLQLFANKRGVKLQASPGDGIPVVSCDPYRVTQVLGNIVQNAIKHSPKNGTVTVATEKTPEGVRFIVSDEGPGISEKLGEKIFNAYTIGENPDCTNAVGTGLGLFISRAIARCHGGDLTYRNRVEGGAEFSFLLPAIT